MEKKKPAKKIFRLYLHLILFQVYPNYNHIIKAFDTAMSPDTQLILSERGMCHVINAPISKVLTMT